jgi:hypothetical protein
MNERDEYVRAARSMLDELVQAGIDRGHAFACVMLYSIALTTREEAAWARFYHAVARELCDAADRGPLPPAASAVRLLLGDDLGSRTIESELRKRIDAAFVEHYMREASLPS